MAVAETPNATHVRTEKGASLAKGPALILGTILLAAGLYSLYRQHTFPPFSDFPNGNAPVHGKVFGIFGANGWTGMLTAIAGGLLLFGAAQHLLAKTMSLIVGVALGAAAIIALISGNVLGLAAANGWTALAWGIAAVILLFNTLVPRRRRTVPVEDREPRTVGRRDRADAAPAAVEAREERHAEERAAERDSEHADEREYASRHGARAHLASDSPGDDRTVRADDPAVDGGGSGVATRERSPADRERRL